MWESFLIKIATGRTGWYIPRNDKDYARLILMLYFLLFVFELILLFVLSKKLVNNLAQVVYRFTNNHHTVVKVLAILFLPGTIIHELAHLLSAGVMLVPVGEMNVIPEFEEDSIKLGSIQIGKTDPLRRSIVGVAPVLFGLILIFSIFLLVNIEAAPWWQIALALYLIFEIGNTMFSSKKDLEGTIIFVATILILAFAVLAAFYFLDKQLLLNFWVYLSQLNLNFLIKFFKQAGIYLIVPIILDFLIILFSFPFKIRR